MGRSGKVIGFYTKGKGKTRKVIPITASTGARRLSMSEMALTWESLPQGERDKRRKQVIETVYQGDRKAFNRDVDQRPMYLARLLLSTPIVQKFKRPEPKPKPKEREWKITPAQSGDLADYYIDKCKEFGIPYDKSKFEEILSPKKTYEQHKKDIDALIRKERKKEKVITPREAEDIGVKYAFAQKQLEEAKTEKQKKFWKETLEKLEREAKETRLKEPEPKMVLLRFEEDLPAIVGSDLKVYGPFKAEDIASLPSENARVLIKQGAAKEVKEEKPKRKRKAKPVKAPRPTPKKMTHVEMVHLLSFARRFDIDPYYIDNTLTYHENKAILEREAQVKGYSIGEVHGFEEEAEMWTSQYEQYLSSMRAELESAGYRVIGPNNVNGPD